MARVAVFKFQPPIWVPSQKRPPRTGSSYRLEGWHNPYAPHQNVSTDSGGEPLATWRFGSLYSASLSNDWWYPDRLSAMNVGLEQSSAQIAFGLLLDFGWSSVLA